MQGCEAARLWGLRFYARKIVYRRDQRPSFGGGLLRAHAECVRRLRTGQRHARFVQPRKTVGDHACPAFGYAAPASESASHRLLEHREPTLLGPAGAALEDVGIGDAGSLAAFRARRCSLGLRRQVLGSRSWRALAEATAGEIGARSALPRVASGPPVFACGIPSTTIAALLATATITPDRYRSLLTDAPVPRAFLARLLLAIVGAYTRFTRTTQPPCRLHVSVFGPYQSYQNKVHSKVQE
jgi:hypothetical protein